MWAATVITLGAWEACAVTSRRVPTITETARRTRHRRAVRAGVVVFSVLMARHLLTA